MAPSFLENFYTHTILILNILQKSYLKSLLVLSETIFFISNDGWIFSSTRMVYG